MHHLLKLLLPVIICISCSREAVAQIHYSESAISSGVNHSYGVGIFGGGVSFFDFNKDGWDDLTIPTGQNGAIEFYLNNSGSFVKMIPAPVFNNHQTKHALWADYDNDGDYDLLLTSIDNGVNLYQNIGDLTMIDVTSVSGLFQETLQTFSGTWADYDNDGYLDIYLGCNNLRNYLYRNTGNGSFEDVTIEAGVTDSTGLALAHAFFDFDKDGWQDIFIANDKWTPNKLFFNNGNGAFISPGSPDLGEVIMDAMSVTVGDYDNNGWLDIYVTNNISGGGDLNGLCALFQNNADGSFSEVAGAAGVTFGGFGWSAQFLDADNDLDLDLYVSGKLVGSSIPSSQMFENSGNGSFVLPNNAGFSGDTVRSFGNAVGDYNNDGKLDIFVSNHLYTSQLWTNDSGSSNWLKVFLEGEQSNRDGIGSWIEIYLQEQKYARFTNCGESYLAQNSQYHHFGLGPFDIVDSLKVIWPSGTVTLLENISANQLITVTENSPCNSTEIVLSDSLIIFDDGNATGSIFVNFNGGASPYSFSWSNGSTIEHLGNLESGFYDLSITDSFGCQAVFSFSVGLQLATSDQSHIDQNINLFPNPFDGLIFLESENNRLTGADLFIYDRLGIEIYRASIKGNTIQLPNSIANGLYFFELKFEGKMILSQKMMKF